MKFNTGTSQWAVERRRKPAAEGQYLENLPPQKRAFRCAACSTFFTLLPKARDWRLKYSPPQCIDVVLLGLWLRKCWPQCKLCTLRATTLFPWHNWANPSGRCHPIRPEWHIQCSHCIPQWRWKSEHWIRVEPKPLTILQPALPSVSFCVAFSRWGVCVLCFCAPSPFTIELDTGAQSPLPLLKPKVEPLGGVLVPYLVWRQEEHPKQPKLKQTPLWAAQQETTNSYQANLLHQN